MLEDENIESREVTKMEEARAASVKLEDDNILIWCMSSAPCSNLQSL